jgi:hypothetical protein
VPRGYPIGETRFVITAFHRSRALAVRKSRNLGGEGRLVMLSARTKVQRHAQWSWTGRPRPTRPARDRRTLAAQTKEDHVTRSILLRAVAGAVAALAIAAPAASASEDGPSVPVCNQASLYFQGGGLVALDPATDSPAARYTDDLTELPGNGEGLVTAAGHSPALTVCGDDAPPPPVDA